jgi:ABC-type transporter Mla subunit MlaD
VSDYETTQKKRNIIVGIFVVIAFGALGVMIYKFGELPGAVTKVGSFQVQVQFPTAPGVQRDTPVRFCGYQIGRVSIVNPPKVMRDLNTDKWYHQTLVNLRIDNRYKDNIPEDVQAKLMTRGLGSSYIELKLQTYDVNAPTGGFLNEESLLQGSTGMTSEFFPEESQKKLQQLVDGLSELTRNANEILGDPENKSNINEILENAKAASVKANEVLAQATTTLAEAAQTAIYLRTLASTGDLTLKNASQRLDELVIATVDTAEQIAKTASQLRVTLDKINNGKGSAARILNDGKFYENLIENTDQIEMLLQELNAFAEQARKKGIPIKLK